MSRRVEVALLALLTLAIALAVWAGTRGAGGASSFDFRPSTLLRGPEGSGALYDVLVRLRIPVERRRAPLFDLARERRRQPAVLVVLDPFMHLEAAELGQVVRFIRAGGTVVAAGSGGGITRCAGWVTANAARFVASDSFPVQSSENGPALPPVADYLKVPDRSPGALGRLRGGDIEETECDRLAPAAHDTLLRLLDRRPAALRLRYPGGGAVTLVADVGYFRNRTWRATQVPQFITPLLVPTRPGRVAWDEYHQGFGRERSVSGVLAGWLSGTPAGWALLQLGAVLLLALAAAGVRFGPARSVIERRRRSPLEHLEALAAGLEGAADVDTAVALTVSGLRRRLGRAGVMRPDEQRSWLAALELALPTAVGRDAVRRLQRIINQPGGPERALAAAQAVEDVWQELRPLVTRAAS